MGKGFLERRCTGFGGDREQVESGPEGPMGQAEFVPSLRATPSVGTDGFVSLLGF